MKMEVITLTPALARAYLEKNRRNRPISRGTVRRYAEAITNNKWLLTHQGIAVDAKGGLLDGQHRCLAVAETGRSIRTILWSGCSPDTFDVIDQGMSRTPADLYVLMGGKSQTPRRVCRTAMTMIRGTGMNKMALARATVAEYAISHDALLTDFVKILTEDVAWTPTIAGAFCKAALEHTKADIKVLVLRYQAQAWTGAEDPLKKLRDFYIKSRENRLMGGGSFTRELYAYAVRAIRSALTGTELPAWSGKAEIEDFRA